MKQIHKKAVSLFGQLLLVYMAGFSQNPIIQTIYTADPAPMVYKDTVFLYTGHDQDHASYFDMRDWHIYSTTDMVNWTDRGVGLSVKDFKWAEKDAWAGQCIYRDGKFYWYVPVNTKKYGMTIGVAVSDKPTGPFKDALGEPLIKGGWGYIDPTVYIDDDGAAYLYWGNPSLYYVKLNKDMTSYDQKLGVVKVPLNRSGFGTRIIDADHTFGWADTVFVEQAECYQNPGNHKYYWYVAAIEKASGKKVIGVAVGDKMIGPYRDVLGKPFIVQHVGAGNINPTVIVDAKKDTLLTWGNKQLFSVRLNAELLSYDKGQAVQQIAGDQLEEIRKQIAAASNSGAKRGSSYEEGPWFYKRQGKYYLIYPAGGVPEHLAYSMSTGPTGPWKYCDTIMRTIEKGGAFTNHPGVIDFKGQSFLFYHDGALPDGGGFARSVCVEPFDYNQDGCIPRVIPTKKGVGHSLAPLNPYIRQEAETIAWEQGVKTAFGKNAGVYVTRIQNEGYIKVRGVNFNKGTVAIKAALASDKTGGVIEVYVDHITHGAKIGTLRVQATGDLNNWQEQHTKLKSIQGIHDLYFVFKVPAGLSFNFNWWQIAPGL